MFRRFYAFYVTWRFLQCWMSARVAMLLTLRLSTSTFLSREMTETSESSAPQQLSFLTWFMSLTLVLATIMSSLNFTMVTSHGHTHQRHFCNFCNNNVAMICNFFAVNS